MDFVYMAILFALFINVLFIDDAFAAAAGTSDPLGGAMCRVIAVLTGAAAKALATVAIFVVGGGLLMGKFAWPTALTVAIGVIIVFSAGKFVAFIGDSGSSGTTCTTSG